MQNNYPIYNMFNMNYEQQLQQQLQQAAQQLYHNQQMSNVIKAAEKFRDFLNSAENVNPEYQTALMLECFAILNSKMQEHN